MTIHPLILVTDATGNTGSVDLCQVHGHSKLAAMSNSWYPFHPLERGGIIDVRRRSVKAPPRGG
ncbi:hypothetical protein [Sulfobacillus harzensis]|uniref:Uncharacterized protein n=1 Tax=Sulfobacillus harzensis TaxID=2729629 RepID=A0A7Y0Q319_9FIRM|nr:hypothetical protein [Sulfobacillus harzensis]NMP23748.1 hypothetical protein [Sulfobacillus harzensis]